MVEYTEVSQQIQEIEAFLKYVFEEILQVESTAIELLIVDQQLKNVEFRIKLMEVLFENLRVASLNFINSAVASLFLFGKTSGSIVELGHKSSNVVQIFDGFILKHALQLSSIGGIHSSQIIEKDLQDSSQIDFLSMKKDKVSLINSIKEGLSELSMNYEEQIKPEFELDVEDKSFELPDGKIITLTNEAKFKSGEILLNPQKFLEGEKALSDRIQESILKCELGVQRIVSKNILLSGGASLTKNLKERLVQDLQNNRRQEIKEFQVYGEIHRPHSSWIGGSLIGSIQTFQNLKIKKQDYEESSDSRANFLFKKTIIYE